MNKVSLVLVISAIGLLVFVFFFKKDKPIRTLPIMGQHDVNEKNDTVYHSIADFHFMDQAGKEVSLKSFENKIFVADYFFATCGSICPVMTGQMKRVADQFKSNPDIKFISYTVDPEGDSVSVLKEYAAKHGADASQWHFVTGDKKQLYELARTSYYLDADENEKRIDKKDTTIVDAGGHEDFIHTPYFALIDKQKRIRGYYNGTDSLEINKLITDIEVLLEEYKK